MAEQSVKTRGWKLASGYSNKRYKTVNDVIGALKLIESKGEKLEEHQDLVDSSRAILENNGIKEIYVVNNLEEIIKALEKIKQESVEKIIDEIKIDDNNPKALRKDEAEVLIRQQEEHKKNLEVKEKESKTKQFIERQQELYKKNLEKLEKLKKQNVTIKENVDSKVTNKINDKIKTEVEIITKEQIVLENRIEKKLEGTEKAKEISRDLSEKIIEEIVQPEYGSVNEEVEKLVETYVKPENKNDFKEEFKEIVEVAKAEVEIENKIEESVNSYVEELKQNEKLADRIERNEIEIRDKTKEILLEKFETEETIQNDLSNKIIETISKNEPTLGEQEKTAIRIETTKIEIGTDNWINAKTVEINTYRGNVLVEKIEAAISDKNLKLRKEEIGQIKEYQKLVKDIYYPKNGSNIDQFKSESFETAFKSGVEPGRVNNETWNDVKAIARIARMTPEQFKNYSEKFNLANNALKGKLPYNIKECGSLDRVMSAFENNPALKKLLNVSQKLSGFYEKVGGFIPNLKMKLGMKVGEFVVERIGNQAIKGFAQNALSIIAKNGFQDGLGMILKGLITRGAVSAGTAAAGGASVAVAAVGAAIPGVGWIVAGASLLLSPILNKIKEGLQNIFGEKLGGLLSGGLNIFGGVKLAPLAGKLGGLLGLGGGTAAAGGAAVATGAGTAVAAPAIGVTAVVVIVVIAGMFVLNLATNNQMAASMVPPKGSYSYEESTDANDIGPVNYGNYGGVVNNYQSNGLTMYVFEENSDGGRMGQRYDLAAIDGGVWLEKIPSKYNAGTSNDKLDKRIIPAYVAMIEAARADGINPDELNLISGYRSISSQQTLWNNKIAEYRRLHPEWSEERILQEARVWVATPGGSPHHTGRAIDIVVNGGTTSSGGVVNQKNSTTFRWLQNNAATYGFYNYAVEPWHWEYNPPQNTL